MKTIVLFSLLFLSSVGYSQLISGTLLEEGRRMLTETDFILGSHSEGVIYFELAVDREGNVTSERLLGDKTTIHSTPTILRARKLCHEFKFEKGTHYPKFHHVVVKISAQIQH